MKEFVETGSPNTHTNNVERSNLNIRDTVLNSLNGVFRTELPGYMQLFMFFNNQFHENMYVFLFFIFVRNIFAC